MTKGKKDKKPTGPLWTPEEAATYWRVNIESVYRWIRTKKINSIPVGRSYRIPKEQVLSGCPRN